MERNDKFQSFLERQLNYWGGIYILRMLSYAQLSSFLAALFGIIYILIAATLDERQIAQLFTSVISFVILANLLLPIFSSLATADARARLDTIIKGKPNRHNKTQEEMADRAWQEISAFPRRYAIVEALTAYFLVVLPVVLFMRWIGGVEIIQAVHIGIGGFLSGTIVVFQNGILLERMLGPVRTLLLPRDIEQQKLSKGLPLQIRLQVMIVVLITTAVISIGAVGYETLINSSLPDIDISSEVVQFQGQVLLLGLMILGVGFFVGRMMTQSISLPVLEVTNTLERAQAGDLSARAMILTSDEALQLTLQLNQFLDQFKSAQTNLEKEVDERTAALSRKTNQLLAAAQISRDTSTAGDLNTLLFRTVELVSSHFGYYHIGIYLIDSVGEFAILQAASSEGGKKLLTRGHKIEVGQRCAVGLAAYQGRTRIVADTGQDPNYIETPELPLAKSEAAIPLIVRGKTYGVLDIESTERDAFSPEEVDLLQTLAEQITLAIQNTELVEESRSAFAQLEASQSENVRRTWVERGTGNKHSYRYTPTSLTPSSLAGGAATNALEDTVQIDIPISLRGQTIGNIVLHHKGNTAWSEADRSLASEVASQIGLALENSRLLQDAQQRAIHEQTLSNLTARLGRSVDADTLLQTTVRELHLLPNVTEVSVFLSPPEKPKTGEN